MYYEYIVDSVTYNVQYIPLQEGSHSGDLMILAI